MWRGSVSYNDLIAELRNTWMKKPYNPKSRLYSSCSGVSYHGMWAKGQFSCLSRGLALQFMSSLCIQPSVTSLQGDTSHRRDGRTSTFLSHTPVDRAFAAGEQHVDKCLASEQGLVSNSGAAEASRALQPAASSQLALQIPNPTLVSLDSVWWIALHTGDFV